VPFVFVAKHEKVELDKLREQIISLNSQRNTLVNEVENLKSKHRIEKEELVNDRKIADEDIKHMVKIKTEQLEIEHEKKNMEKEKTLQAEVAKVKDEYRDKIEKNLEDESKRTQEMYNEILEIRIPVGLKEKKEYKKKVFGNKYLPIRVELQNDVNQWLKGVL